MINRKKISEAFFILQRCVAVAFVFCILMLFSAGCSSSGGIKIPGENDRILKNIASEYYAIAEGYLNLKNYVKAIEYYKLAMRRADFARIAYYKMGYAYALANDWANAELIYSDLLSQDPENASLAMSLAYITAKKGDIALAVSQYKKLIELQPLNKELRENYIALLIAAGEKDTASEQLLILKTDFPDSPSIEALEKKLSATVEAVP